eukprot:jgi/Mesvir1/897/Mv17459-RA.1
MSVVRSRKQGSARMAVRRHPFCVFVLWQLAFLHLGQVPQAAHTGTVNGSALTRGLNPGCLTGAAAEFAMPAHTQAANTCSLNGIDNRCFSHDGTDVASCPGVPQDFSSPQESSSTCPSATAAPPPEPPPFPGDEYIVRFKGYHPVAELRARLEAALGPSDTASWRWLDRINPAMEKGYPTDFALVRLPLDAQGKIDPGVKKAILGIESVKDIWPQMRHTRAPLSMGATEDGSGVQRKPGRLLGKFSFGLGGEGTSPWDAHGPLGGRYGPYGSAARRVLQAIGGGRSVTSMFEAEKLWSQGFSGAGVKMAVFDTGVRADHPHFRNIKERTNWTHENTLNDGLGHGTFVAGVISSQDKECPGFAQDVGIYAFRVFTNDQVSYTSWFLDAFNYAIVTEMNILNLSIGGPDFLDKPFVEKVWEMTANNIIMVSAIGNDGPLYGTLNNPADQMDVIGVGGIDYNHRLSGFSSRGMSTWELPRGYGRAKPDVMAFGHDVVGSKITTGCRSLSGTSVASPVVAGAVCLLASVVPPAKRWEILNPASMKQALIEGAVRLKDQNLYEQGMGKLNLVASHNILKNYVPRASVSPAKLDFTDCPYMWPFCKQPLYAGAMPVIFNATIINGMGVTGTLEGEPRWVPKNKDGQLLDIRFTYSDVLWPWSGFLGIFIRVLPEGARFQGTVEGTIQLTVTSPPGPGEHQRRRFSVSVPLKAAVIPTPPRERRILWDQFHNVKYPPAYIPRDNLDIRNDILDWHGDHPHTNFHGMYDFLRNNGYYLEVLGSPYTCFDARQYGALLLVDPEEEYYPAEIAKLKNDVEEHGLGLIVFAEWYNVDAMIKMRFFDDNTRSWWTPATGGANIPALNDLLKVFGIQFGDTVLTGQIALARKHLNFASGVPLVEFPHNGVVHAFQLQARDSPGAAHHHATFQRAAGPGGVATGDYPVLGLVQHVAKGMAANVSGVNSGRIFVLGDCNCLDSSHQTMDCYWLLESAMEYTARGRSPPGLLPATAKGTTGGGSAARVDEPFTGHVLTSPMVAASSLLPRRRTDISFVEYSTVLQEPRPTCMLDSSFAPEWAGKGGGGRGGVGVSGVDPQRMKPSDKPAVTTTVTAAVAKDSGGASEASGKAGAEASASTDAKNSGRSAGGNANASNSKGGSPDGSTPGEEEEKIPARFEGGGLSASAGEAEGNGGGDGGQQNGGQIGSADLSTSAQGLAGTGEQGAGAGSSFGNGHSSVSDPSTAGMNTGGSGGSIRDVGLRGQANESQEAKAKEIADQRLERLGKGEWRPLGDSLTKPFMGFPRNQGGGGGGSAGDATAKSDTSPSLPTSSTTAESATTTTAATTTATTGTAATADTAARTAAMTPPRRQRPRVAELAFARAQAREGRVGQGPWAHGRSGTDAGSEWEHIKMMNDIIRSLPNGLGLSGGEGGAGGGAGIVASDPQLLLKIRRQNDRDSPPVATTPVTGGGEGARGGHGAESGGADVSSSGTDGVGSSGTWASGSMGGGGVGSGGDGEAASGMLADGAVASAATTLSNNQELQFSDMEMRVPLLLGLIGGCGIIYGLYNMRGSRRRHANRATV